MDLEKICRSVIDIAKNAGAFIAGERTNFDLKLVEIKGKANFVRMSTRKPKSLLSKV